MAKLFLAARARLTVAAMTVQLVSHIQIPVNSNLTHLKF